MPRKQTLESSQHASLAREVRRDIISMTAAAGSGHYMSSLSSVEILIALYFSVLRYDPDDPSLSSRDRVILSKGHAVPALYAVLARAGFFPVDELSTLRRMGSRLQGHPIFHLLPGLDASSGSLGQGLSTAVGMAVAARQDQADWRVYVVMGDGELQEGQVWEAVMAAARFRLDNLVLVVDCNGLQATGSIQEIMPLANPDEVFRAFGWHVQRVDGHRIPDLSDALRRAGTDEGKPSVILARTVKGKGVPFLEANLRYHSAPLTEEEVRVATECLQ